MKLLLLVLCLAGCAIVPPKKTTPAVQENKVQTYLRGVSLDVGAEIQDGFYSSLGVSFPVGPVYLSGGYWGGVDWLGDFYQGYYLSTGWSWMLFDR